MTNSYSNFEESQHFHLHGSSRPVLTAWSMKKKALRFLDKAKYSRRFESSKNTTLRKSELVLKTCFTIKSLDIWIERSRFRIPEGARLFPPFQTVWTGYGTYAPSCSKDTGAVLSTGVNGLGSDLATRNFTNRILLCVSHGCQKELRPYSIKWLVSVLEMQYLFWAISKKLKGEFAL